MLSVFKWRRRTKEARAWTLATRHGNRTLLVRVIKDWRASAVEEMIDASDLAERGEILLEHMLMRTHLRAWIIFVAPLRASRALAENRAMEQWRERTKDVLFRRWRNNVLRIVERRARMIDLRQRLLPLEWWNSLRERPKVESAVTFHRRRVLRKAWVGFVNLNVELADIQRRYKVSVMVTVCERTARTVVVVRFKASVQQSTLDMKRYPVPILPRDQLKVIFL